MLRYKILIITLLFYNYSNAQDDNTIPLKELSLCTFNSKVDVVEKVLSKYGYNFVGGEKGLFRGKDADKYTFDKKTEGVEEQIVLYKKPEFDPFDYNFKITYSCMFQRNYDDYKKVMESDTSNKFVRELIQGDCFNRYYVGNLFDYSFSVCRTKYPNNPLYILLIEFNNGKGALRNALKTK